MIYRPEIDGLRALAVLPVLLFHARTPGFHGGFILVAVFFVISGYLITAIILQDLNKGAFSLGQFYERRARRILPALYFVILCSIPMVWIVAMPSQLKDFSQSLVAISAIAANIFFYLKVGYFEPATELNPLLHVWSLAVEEQFYFIFPIFLILSFRWLRQGIVPLILLLSIASFMIAQSLLATDPSQSFFLPFGRAWELMIGALLNFLPKRTKSWKLGWEIGATLGLSMIVGSIFILNETHPFPGLLALPPTFGTALVIYCTSSSFGIGKLLANRLAVGIGLVSYSTYLWHQPLFAIARIHVLGDPPLFVFLILSLLSIGLAYLTWRYIERPFRNKKVIPRKTLVIACIAAIAPVVALGISGHMTDGFKEIK
ncbi:MAG: acyltransferase family protein, partial [Actinomycetales bacterium]|nr:acyltransferase family protein [Actinomycetales bacterium]